MLANIGNWAYVLKSKLGVAIARRGDDALKLAHSVRHLGDAYAYAGRWVRAEPCYVEALSIYRRHERTRPLDLANAIRSFAVLKDEVGATDQSQSRGRKRTICTWISTCPLALLRALRASRCWRVNGATWRAAANV